MKRPLRRNSDKVRLRRLIYLVVGILCVGFLLPRVVTLVGVVVMTPIHTVQVWFKETSLAIPALWREKIELQERILQLESELTFAVNPSLSEQLLQEENNTLRSLLGATTSARIAAIVTARPSQLPYDVLQIDQGKSSGVTVGAPVYQNETEVIGLVSRVTEYSAYVTLFTTPGFTTTAYLSGSQLLVRLEGVGGGVARVAVPQGIQLTERDLVHIPSIQPGVYGRISYIESEPTDPQQFGYIVSDTPIGQLRYVSVGLAGDVTTEVQAVETYLAEINKTLTLPPITSVPLATTSATSSPAETNLNEVVRDPVIEEIEGQ